MKTRYGWQFPDADEFMVHELTPDGGYQQPNLMAALQHVSDWSTAVDCGAHAGTWSRIMSDRFQRVIAVEPSTDTFEALMANMAAFGCGNVECRNVAVGDKSTLVHMTLKPEQELIANTGARFIAEGGTIPVETIDSWNLPALGFLKLDIEGSEAAALRGAVETLKRCRPVVLFENKWLWQKNLGEPKDAVVKVLKSVGYQMTQQVSRDQIWRFSK